MPPKRTPALAELALPGGRKLRLVELSGGLFAEEHHEDVRQRKTRVPIDAEQRVAHVAAALEVRAEEFSHDFLEVLMRGTAYLHAPCP